MKRKIIPSEYQSWVIQKRFDEAKAKRLGISVNEVKARRDKEAKVLNEIRNEIAKYKSNTKSTTKKRF
jgi:hypothetical protein